MPMFALALAAACVAVSSPAAAATSQRRLGEYAVKAVYLFNFTRYIKWPESAFDDEKSPFIIGVAGDVPKDLGTALNYYARKKKVGNRPIRIELLKRPEDAADCQIVFVRRTVEEELLREVLVATRERPVLLAGETDEFLESGGTTSLRLVDSRIRIGMMIADLSLRKLRADARLLALVERYERARK